jgi:hypothetical protein
MKRLAFLAIAASLLAAPAFAAPPPDPTSFEGLFAKLTSQEGQAYGLEVAVSNVQGAHAPQGPDTALCALGTKYYETVLIAAEQVKFMPPRPADSPIGASQADGALNWPAVNLKRAEMMQRTLCREV